VDHRLTERLGDGDDHRRVFTGRVAGLVILGFDVTAPLVEQEERFLPGAGNAIGVNVQNGDARHETFT
jgi:hypothetical protein